MQKTVLLLDGPIGAGKTSLGRECASRLGFAFIDGDDHCAGPWLRSVLTASRSIAAASLEALEDRAAVIVAYPVRCTNWVFYSRTFERSGITCRCIGLIADPNHIATRERILSAAELARSAEMIGEGYGQRTFSDLILRTDEAGFDETSERLTRAIRHLLAQPVA